MKNSYIFDTSVDTSVLSIKNIWNFYKIKNYGYRNLNEIWREKTKTKFRHSRKMKHHFILHQSNQKYKKIYFQYCSGILESFQRDTNTSTIV